MGGLVFSVAIVVAILAVAGRAIARRVRQVQLPDTVAVVSWADIPAALRRRHCPCGRLPDELGERCTDEGVIVSRECVCGRTERVTFVLAQ